MSDCFVLVNGPLNYLSRVINGQLFPFHLPRYDYLEIVNDGRMVGKYWGHSFNWRPNIDQIPLRL